MRAFATAHVQMMIAALTETSMIMSFSISTSINICLCCRDP